MLSSQPNSFAPAQSDAASFYFPPISTDKARRHWDRVIFSHPPKPEQLVIA